MEGCEVCKQGRCQHGEKCCRCNDYDYVIACLYCSQVFELREPTNQETISAIRTSMKNAELLRSSPKLRTNSQKVPPLEIPKLSPDFVFFWSQNSPTSPLPRRMLDRSSRSDHSARSDRSTDSDAETGSE